MSYAGERFMHMSTILTTERSAELARIRRCEASTRIRLVPADAQSGHPAVVIATSAHPRAARHNLRAPHARVHSKASRAVRRASA